MNCESSERHEPEREDAGRVGDRHGGAEQDRVARLALVPTRYPATSALPWPGVSACTAPQKAAISSESEDHADREVAALDQRLEPAARVLRRRGRADRRGPALRRCPAA